MMHKITSREYINCPTFLGEYFHLQEDDITKGFTQTYNINKIKFIYKVSKL